MVLSNPLYLSEIKLYPLKVVASQLNNSLQNHNPKLGILFLQFLILSSLQNFYENISIVNNPYILYKEFLESELFNLYMKLFIFKFLCVLMLKYLKQWINDAINTTLCNLYCRNANVEETEIPNTYRCVQWVFVRFIIQTFHCVLKSCNQNSIYSSIIYQTLFTSLT